MSEGSDISAAIEALAAEGPYPEHAEKLMLFGQFVGSWDVDATYFDRDGTLTAERRGEWHFGWVLEGRAIQDVLTTPPREERRRTGAPAKEYGTTVRFYDPRIDAWRVTWMAPVFGGVTNLIARQVGNDIVLEGRGPDESLERWTFSEITPDAFRWRGEVSSDEGRTWFTNEEMRVRRRPAA